MLTMLIASLSLSLSLSPSFSLSLSLPLSLSLSSSLSRRYSRRAEFVTRAAGVGAQCTMRVVSVDDRARARARDDDAVS